MKSIIKKTIFVLLDYFIIISSIYIALLITSEKNTLSDHSDVLLYSFTCALLCSIPMYILMGLYSRLWAYASIDEVLQIFFATLSGKILEYCLGSCLDLKIFPTVYFISWLITLFLVGGLRFCFRLRKKISKLCNLANYKKRVMIIGAGNTGSMLIKEIKSKMNSTYKPIAVIDDDTTKHKTKINGVPIVGGRSVIADIVKKMEIDEIIIALPSIPRSEMSLLINVCKSTHCKLKTLPGIYSIVNEEVSIKEIRDINIEDLLGRDEISLNTEEIAHYLKGQTILVTGGGGSIGSELCRQIAKYSPKTLLIFDIYENNAYDLQNELLVLYKNTIDIRIIIGSVRDKFKLEQVFSKYQPKVVFHAAAHKHVPLMEENPDEAIKNNVLGTLKLAECAHKFKCSKFILISTDKAVNPTNIMGATKRIAEMIIQYMDKNSDTKYAAVRFGNVLGSNGSVIPLFMKQIEQGGPITITHPEINRFFMTIPEASSLVIQAGAMAEGGEIFILDMGKPVKIVDLAKALITLSGLEPEVDISIEFTGLRPGEKLYEELLVKEDGVNITKNNKIYIEKTDYNDLSPLIKEINSIQYKDMHDAEEIKNFIKNAVPSYRSET